MECSSCNINSLTASLFAFTSKTLPILCVINEFIFGLQYETHVPQYLAQFLYLATSLYLFFIIALISRLLYRLLKVVFAIRLARTLLNVNNHIKGAVMIETIFIGMATACFGMIQPYSLWQ
jgi:hypothetical protein